MTGGRWVSPCHPITLSGLGHPPRQKLVHSTSGHRGLSLPRKDFGHNNLASASRHVWGRVFLGSCEGQSTHVSAEDQLSAVEMNGTIGHE